MDGWTSRPALFHFTLALLGSSQCRPLLGSCCVQACPVWAHACVDACILVQQVCLFRPGVEWSRGRISVCCTETFDPLVFSLACLIYGVALSLVRFMLQATPLIMSVLSLCIASTSFAC